MSDKWDRRFLELAQTVAQWSKDPSTKVGAVITRPDLTVASLGYNGFPRGVEDTEARYDNRDTKYALVVHAEANAIVHARENLAGYTIYLWPFAPCSDCAGLVIQAGIQRVVVPVYNGANRWHTSHSFGALMYREADINITEVPL